MSGTILSIKYQEILSSRQNQILPLCLILYFQKENADIAEEAPAEVPTPAPATAPTLEIVEERPHTPGSRKSTRKNFGRPASAYSDFYM